MPTPNKGESQKDFVSRCIPMVMDEGTAKDNKQAAAVCYSMYKEHMKKKQSGAVALSMTLTKAQRMSDGRIRWQARANSGKFDQQGERFDRSLFDDVVTNFWREQEARSKGQAVPGYAHPEGMPAPIIEIAHYSLYLPKSQRNLARAGWVYRAWRDGDALMLQGYYDESEMGQAAAKSVLEDESDEIKVSICLYPDWDMVEQTSQGNVYKGGRGVAYMDHLAHTTVPVDALTQIDAEVEPMAKSLSEDALGVLKDPELVKKLEEARAASKSEAAPDGALIKADGDQCEGCQGGGCSCNKPAESAQNAGAAPEVTPPAETPASEVDKSKVHVTETYTNTTTSDRVIEKDKAADTIETQAVEAAAQAAAAQAPMMAMSQAAPDPVLKSLSEDMEILKKALTGLPALIEQVDALTAKVKAMETDEARKVKAAIENPAGWLAQVVSARNDPKNVVKAEDAPKPPETKPAPKSVAEAIFNRGG